MKHIESALLVDDSEMSNFITGLILKQINPDIRISTVLNGKEAIRWLDKCNGIYPSVILLDINMPLMDGFEFLKWYQSSRHKGNNCIAILSSSSRSADRKTAFSFKEVVDYIEKPLSKKKIKVLSIKHSVCCPAKLVFLPNGDFQYDNIPSNCYH